MILTHIQRFNKKNLILQTMKVSYSSYYLTQSKIIQNSTYRNHKGIRILLSFTSYSILLNLTQRNKLKFNNIYFTKVKRVR